MQTSATVRIWALGTLVMMVNEQELGRLALHATLDAEREHNKRLSSENQRLQSELDQVKLELKLERQNKFATNQQKQDSGKTTGRIKRTNQTGQASLIEQIR